MEKVKAVLGQVKAFLGTPTSNLFGIGLGSALVMLNIINFSLIGIVAGVFLVASEGLQYWERKQ